MTNYEEILKACTENTMPKVKCNENVKDFANKTGKVVALINIETSKGVRVNFGNGPNIYFEDSQEIDKKRRFLRDLTIV